MFLGCSSLISFPDISKWKINKVGHICRLFYGCSSLISLPDISKLDIRICDNIFYIFNDCFSLIPQPKIVQRKISKNMNRICTKCDKQSLISFFLGT